MEWTREQVESVAPDSKSIAAAQKLSQVSKWGNTGRSDEGMMWGQCQGSGSKPYQVFIDNGNFAHKCSCPSRKLPCKHVLALLFIISNDPSAVPVDEQPPLVTEWQNARETRAKKKEQTASDAAQRQVTDPDSQKKRAEKREKRVADGINLLQRWLEDIVRGGLAGLEMNPFSFWEEMARRLVDAQAQGLAGYVRRLGETCGAGADWPDRLLAEMGKLQLLLYAYGNPRNVSPELVESLRQRIGWNLQQEEVKAAGREQTDTWTVVGQVVQQEDRLTTESTWLLGEKSRQVAHVLQFSVNDQPFPTRFIPGASFKGKLYYYPGASETRALVVTQEATDATAQQISGHDSIESFLGVVADSLAVNPWQDQFLCIVDNVRPASCIRVESTLYFCDASGAALPVAKSEAYRVLAFSGGRPVTLFGIWDGRTLIPVGCSTGDCSDHWKITR